MRDAITVCGGKQRERHVYLSRSNRVEIRIFARKKTANFPFFLMRYEGMSTFRSYVLLNPLLIINNK